QFRRIDMFLIRAGISLLSRIASLGRFTRPLGWARQIRKISRISSIGRPRCTHPDNRHALFLWGHGPELLFDEDATPKAEGADGKTKNSGKPIRKYLTPSELKTALSKTLLKKKIDILGMDACSMSMAEIASELGDYVKFMVASQEDVPDLSFP